MIAFYKNLHYSKTELLIYITYKQLKVYEIYILVTAFPEVGHHKMNFLLFVTKSLS